LRTACVALLRVPALVDFTAVPPVAIDFVVSLAKATINAQQSCA